MKANTIDWMTRLALTFAPSSFQAAIFYWVEHGRGHAVIEAVAGSGKTTTIVAAAKLLSGDGLFVAFNKEIANLLGEKLKGTTMDSSTVHSHGFAAVRANVRGRVKVDGSKYKKALDCIRADVLGGRLLGEDLKPAENAAIQDDGFPRSQILQLLDKARLGLVDFRAPTAVYQNEILDLADHHRVEIEPGLEDIVVDIVRELMSWGASYTHEIDFADMVWLPVVNGYRPTKYSWIFVDECQDTTAAARELIKMSLKQGGRSLWVGDRKQAIYGFMGADSASFQKIIDELDATVLPLSVCYRCPTKVLDLAREDCPQIEARPGAPEGIVRSVTRDQLLEEAREGDMILCRLNAPLVSLCFSLIGAGVAAKVRGRSIGDGLIKVVTDACKKLSDFSRFGEALDAYEDRERDRARKRSRDEDLLADALEAINDKVECIRVIHSNSSATSPAALKQSIAALFDDGRPSVVLSSIHRSKGLEAERVFIAKPERLGVARKGARAWQAEQELHLRYVARTRAMCELVTIDGEAPGEPDPDDLEDRPVEFKAPAHPAPKTPALPAALPSVDTDAPDTYDAGSRPARVALARRLDQALRARGFAPVQLRGVTEVVYEGSAYADRCRVYSTIEGGEVRGLGKDAIRVGIVRANGSFAGSRRVNRVGLIAKILARVENRIDLLGGVRLPEAFVEAAGEAGGEAGGEHDDGPALLPTEDSIRRAGLTLASGENFMRDGEVSDQDRADAYLD